MKPPATQDEDHYQRISAVSAAVAGVVSPICAWRSERTWVLRAMADMGAVHAHPREHLFPVDDGIPLTDVTLLLDIMGTGR